jgi:lipoprotein-releasing system ATP-binding protein
MLSARNIHKSFKGVEILKGIDMDAAEAEIVAIVGPSGAGKTTLLQILGTLEQADQGEVTIAGTGISSLSGNGIADFRNNTIGFIFQFHHLLPEFSALENVAMPGMISGKGLRECEGRAGELLKYLGLGDRLKNKPSELSGGEQQRVAVARALMNKPKVIFADEPSGNLDSANAAELHDLFFRLREDFGHTFIIVTHNSELADSADRKLQMADGLMIS